MNHRLSELIQLNANFKASVNLYLDLNRPEKIENYIPTKSSLDILREYLEAVSQNNNHSTILVGPYGKGKSLLLLLLISVLSLKDTAGNNELIGNLSVKIKKTEYGKPVADLINRIRSQKKRYIPVLIQNAGSDLQRAFIHGLYEALKREGLENIIPDTAYTVALSRIKEWKKDYPATYSSFVSMIKEKSYSITSFTNALREYSSDALRLFTEIHPQITAGSVFNPLITSDVFTLYQSIGNTLCNEYGYAGLYIVFDEFSKYIEGQSDKNSGNEMDLLQNMCELANNSANGEIFFTMVAHKRISEYSKYLPADFINSFTGIEGRMKEILFVTSTKNNYELIMQAMQKTPLLSEDDAYNTYTSPQRVSACYNIPCFRTGFTAKDFENIVAKGCYPLTPIGAFLLLNISEKVAQNERTLFTFIANDEAGSAARFIKNHSENENPLITAEMIYDYFSGLFKKDGNNVSVHNVWLNAEYALSKCKTDIQRKFVKTLACFLIVNKEELPATSNYLLTALGTEYDGDLIGELKELEVIYKRESSDTYLFKTRAGSSLKKEIKNRRGKQKAPNYVSVFESVLQRPYIIPKKYNSDHKMTRYYRHEFISVDAFLSINDPSVFAKEAFCDGVVLSLFKITGEADLDFDTAAEHLKKLGDQRVILIIPEKKLKFKNQIFDYESIQELKNSDFFAENSENEVFMRELPLLEEDIENVIRKKLDEVYSEDNKCRVIFQDKDGNIQSFRFDELEKAVARSCEETYPRTPLINNEIINRNEITTSPTKKSRLKIIEAILSGKADEGFYENTGQEATIYRSLLTVTKSEDGKTFTGGVQEIIDETERFVSSCSGNRQSLSLLVDKLLEPPYGMRRAVIPVYLAYVLSLGNEDKVIYFSESERQLSPEIVVNMCERPEDYSLFISKESAEKEKYIKELNAAFYVNESRNLSDNRIKNIVTCMQRWFRSLPQISRNLADFNMLPGCSDEERTKIRRFRDCLQPLDINPYELLFKTLPDIFGSNNDFSKTVAEIIDTRKFLDGYLSSMLSISADAALTVFGARKSEHELYHLLKDWYLKQSDAAKQGILDGHANGLMSCIEKLNVYDNSEVIKRLVKASTDVYIENWNDGSFEAFKQELADCKNIAESTSDTDNSGRCSISYTDSRGEQKTRYYDKPQADSGIILKNVIEDTLEDFDDLSVNERISVLVDMIDKLFSRT